MDAENAGTPAAQPRQPRKPRRLALTVVEILVALAVVAAVAAYFLMGAAPDDDSGISSRIREIASAVRTGDFDHAAEARDIALNAAGSDATERAAVTYGAFGSDYRVTGDIAARIADIADMKAIILDESVPLRIRVNTLNLLANQYAISGNDPAVFAEIYKDEPFSAYLAPGNPNLSASRLAEWSYSMFPTSNAAIFVARWYSDPDAADETADGAISNTDIAADYLQRADLAAVQEAESDPGYGNSARYLVYRYWKAIVIGRLAEQVGEPYTSRLATEFDGFFGFAQQQQNVLAPEYVLYARFLYALLLDRMGDQAAATAQVELLAQELTAVSNPEVNVFIRFLKSEAANNPSGRNWRGAVAMAELSPAFKAAVQQVTGVAAE